MEEQTAKPTRKKTGARIGKSANVDTRTQTPVLETKEKAPRNTAEFRIDPVDSQLARASQAQKDCEYHEKETLAKILRRAVHTGLLVEIALAGPNKDGLYAGFYTGTQIAQLIRLHALGLTDVVARHSIPIFQPMLSTLSSPSVPQKEANSSQGGTLEVDEKGASTLKGLGAGLLKKKTIV